jgi:hypothetical protein
MKRCRLFWISCSLVIAAQLTGCGQPSHNAKLAKPFVTDVDHSPVKRQSIGNCWLYAQASWVESLHLSATGEFIDVSESYWTWWYWYEQIHNSARRGYRIDAIQTGGSWRTAQHLMRTYGLIREGDFIPREAGSQASGSQARAEQIINYHLAQGELSRLDSRTPETIRQVLDEAFGTDMSQAESLVTAADDFVVATGQDLDQTSRLTDVMGQWQQYSLARYDDESVLQFMRQALNDGQPVVMTFWVDFRYLNTDTATFQGPMFDPQYDGNGGHLVVLEDYVVDHPELGRLGEGDMDDATKDQALNGDLVYLKAKNSWGTDRPERGLTDGYTRFTMDYLLESSAEEIGYQYTSFVLPTGDYF